MKKPLPVIKPEISGNKLLGKRGHFTSLSNAGTKDSDCKSDTSNLSFKPTLVKERNLKARQLKQIEKQQQKKDKVTVTASAFGFEDK
jgi:hypothetical protein